MKSGKMQRTEQRESYVLCTLMNCLKEREDGKNLKPSLDYPAKSFGLELTSHLPTQSFLSFSIHVAPCHRPLFPTDLQFLCCLKLLLHLSAQKYPAASYPLSLFNRHQLGKKFYFHLQAVTVTAFWGQLSNHENCKGQQKAFLLEGSRGRINLWE